MNLKVLIVDDSPLLRATARRAALLAGIAPSSLREASHGREALDALLREPADIVLLDVNMPVMDGLEFLETKLRHPELANVMVALVTTETNQARLQRMRELGVRHYLRKPFQPEELRALVKDLCLS